MAPHGTEQCNDIYDKHTDKLPTRQKVRKGKFQWKACRGDARGNKWKRLNTGNHASAVDSNNQRGDTDKG